MSQGLFPNTTFNHPWLPDAHTKAPLSYAIVYWGIVCFLNLLGIVKQPYSRALSTATQYGQSFFEEERYGFNELLMIREEVVKDSALSEINTT